MLEQLGRSHSALGVLGEYLEHKVPVAIGELELRGEQHFVGEDLAELALVLDLEWYAAHHQLEGQDADGPQIHLLVVALAGELLGGDVQRRPAEGVAQVVAAIDCPPEIAQFDGALSKCERVTWTTTMFSGLMSRWRSFLECMWLTEARRSLMMSSAPYSLYLSFRLSLV